MLLPFLLASILLVVLFKSYLISRMKGFDVAAILLSFFRLYNHDDRNVTTNKKRIVFMVLNNLMNYYVYGVIALAILFYLVTKNI